MSITLTQLVGKTSVGADRLTINQNTQATQDSINSLLNLLDVDNTSLTGIKTLKVFNNPSTTAVPSINTIETNGTIKVDGNVTCGGTITAKTITLSSGSGITVNAGDLTIASLTSMSWFKGNMKVGGATTYTSYGTTFESYKKATFSSGGTYYTTISASEIVGHLDMTSQKGKVLNFTGYVAANTDLNVRRVKLLTTGIVAGQEIELIFVFDDSTGYTFQLEPDNLAYTASYPITTGIVFTKSYGCIKLVFSGTSWIITGIYGGGYSVT